MHGKWPTCLKKSFAKRTQRNASLFGPRVYSIADTVARMEVHTGGLLLLTRPPVCVDRDHDDNSSSSIQRDPCRGAHDFFDPHDGGVDFFCRQRRMNHEHQAGFPQLSRDVQSTGGSESGTAEGLFQVDFTAGTRAAGNSFGLQAFDNAIPVPTRCQVHGANEGIIFIVTM